MADSYAILAPIYSRVGLNAESEWLRGRVFDRLQSEGWLGRRILELGCGIGETACWFAANGFRVTAVDQSEAMLAQARHSADSQGVSVDWRQEDILRFQPDSDFDLVLSMSTLNELHSIRDLEQVFQVANRALSQDKLLFFDLVTIGGLAEQWGDNDKVLYDDPEALTLVVRSRFSFETLANTRAYLIYRHDGEGWHRGDEVHVLRGYALQAVGALLKRTGFNVQNVLNLNLETFDPNADRTGRAIFIAAKERNLE